MHNILTSITSQIAPSTPELQRMNCQKMTNWWDPLSKLSLNSPQNLRAYFVTIWPSCVTLKSDVLLEKQQQHIKQVKIHAVTTLKLQPMIQYTYVVSLYTFPGVITLQMEILNQYYTDAHATICILRPRFVPESSPGAAHTH